MVAARLYVVQSRFQLGCTLPHGSHWNISSSFHSFLIAVAPWIPSIDTEPSSNACYTPFGWLIGSIRSPMSLFINQFKIEYVYIYIIIYDYVCMCVYIYICICLHIYIYVDTVKPAYPQIHLSSVGENSGVTPTNKEIGITSLNLIPLHEYLLKLGV